MISGQSLTCPKGASLTFEIDMDTGSDLTGATAQWALCESWFDQAKVYLTKTGAGDGLFIGQDAGVWKITVNLAPTDTLDIPSGLLYHDCKVLLQSGDVEDIANGPFSLDPSVNILLTNAPITRNLHAVQLLGRLGQTAPLTVAWLARNLLATQNLIGLGQSAAATVTSGGVSPAFQADFTGLTSLPTGVSLSRATIGTYFDASGVLQTAGIDAPRFDHAWNGSGWVATGLLDEEQRTNLLKYSNTFSNAIWGNDGATLSSSGTAPDGSASTKLIETAAGATQSYYQSVGTSSGVYTGSLYLKAGERRYAIVCAGQLNWAVFDLVAGVVTSTHAGVTATMIAVGNGWYRCSVSDTVAVDYFIIAISDVAVPSGQDSYGRPTYTGNGTSGLYMFGAELELSSFATSYIPTTSAAVTRSADIPSSSSPLTGYLAAGPSVWEFQDEATGTIARSAYAAGAFDWPVNKWYRSMGVYPAGTDTSSHMTVGSPY